MQATPGEFFLICALVWIAYGWGQSDAQLESPSDGRRDKVVAALVVFAYLLKDALYNTYLAYTTSTTFRAAVVGSKNPVKVNAVRAALGDYPALASRSSVRFTDAPSGIADQPIGLEIIARGARNRAEAARAAFPGKVLAFGLESGLFAIEGTHYDVCICSAYDGFKHSLGLSCAFAIPPAIIDRVLKDGMDLSQASVAADYSSDSDIGSKGGLIAVLTKGRVSRTDYTVQAVQMALTRVEDPRST